MKNEEDSQEEVTMKNKKDGKYVFVLNDDPCRSDFESEEEYQKARKAYIQECMEYARSGL